MKIHACPRRITLLTSACGLLLSAAFSAGFSAPLAGEGIHQEPEGQQDARMTQFRDVALSPDGKTVAWTLRGSGASSIHLTQISDSASTVLVSIPAASHCISSNPIWAPDGETLAFLSSCTAHAGQPNQANSDAAHIAQDQIFLWSKATRQVTQLTHLTGELQQLAWSPDGKSISFLFVQNATRHAGALDAMPPWNGVIGEDGVEIQRVYSVDAGTGAGRFLTPANLHVYEFDYAPNGRHVAYIAANPPGENNWWVARLYTQSVSGGEPRVILDPNTVPGSLHGLQIAVPRYSPDGRSIAFIGGLMSDQGSTGGDVYIVSSKGSKATGGVPVDVTANIDGTPCFEGWLNRHVIGFVEDRRGHILLSSYNVDSHAPAGAPLDLGTVSIAGGPIKDAAWTELAGGLAFVKRGPALPPEIWAGRWGAVQQVTHLNDAIKLNPPRFESIEWKNEGFNVQGWLTFPQNYDPAKKYPLIVEVHGGPSASAGPRPNAMWSEQGYFVLAPNPRGSFGQGERFVQANRKDFGYGDLRDILKGMDTIEARYPIDKQREGITGWSYGGFMTMFAVTQTNRFHAAVAGAGLSDWLSYYGENSIDQWMIPFFGASVYDDPAVYAKSSAINYVRNVKTPTLVVVGDRDGECPAPQSFEFWHALRDLGVKTQLVVYPNEGHRFRDPAHIQDVSARSIRWFAQNMPAGH